MDAKELLNVLTYNDITDIIIDLGGEVVKETNEYTIFTSICHGSDSHKLYLYHDSKTLKCWSRCGNMSLYDFVMKVNKCGFKDSFNYIRDNVKGYTNRPIIGFEGDIVKQELNEIVVPELKPIEKQFLYNIFKNKEIKEWCKEGISYETQQKFDIRYDARNNQVIIPHRRWQDGKVVGIRIRNMNELKIMRGAPKYSPLFYDDICYSHKLSENLYSLNISKENIKKYKKVIVAESEKACMQYESMFPDNNICVAICGSSFSNVQKKILLDLGIEELVYAVDKEYKEYNSQERIDYERKILKNLEGIKDYVQCSYIIDKNGLLSLKDSPFDRGAKVLKQLLTERVKI